MAPAWNYSTRVGGFDVNRDFNPDLDYVPQPGDFPGNSADTGWYITPEAQTVRDVFRLVSERAVDVINLKVTNLGGIRRFLQAVRICEAGEVGCRVGAAFGPALLQSMSLQAACVIRRLPYACELSEHLHLRDDPFTPLPARDGSLALPDGPGCGVSYRD